jgi:filamentous hemagglutinin family protein
LAARPGLALAGPAGEQLAQGAATVTRPDGNATRIDQTSQNPVLNWQSSSVGDQKCVQCVQPGAYAAVLNRVAGDGGSEILGRLDANGRVLLVNPRGVYCEAGAQVDASGFVASARDIDDADFMAGRYQCAKGTGANGSVTNDGSVSADQFVVLMGNRVDHRGVLQSRLDTAVLAAGSATMLELDESGLVNRAVDEKTAAAMAGVENTGQIVADGGRVLLTAKVADDLVATAVNNASLARAQYRRTGRRNLPACRGRRPP